MASSFIRAGAILYQIRVRDEKFLSFICPRFKEPVHFYEKKPIGHIAHLSNNSHNIIK